MGKAIIWVTILLLVMGFVSSVQYEYLYNPYTGKRDRTRSTNQSGFNLTADFFDGNNSQWSRSGTTLIPTNDGDDVNTTGMFVSNKIISDADPLNARFGNDPAIIAVGDPMNVGAYLGGYYTAGGGASTIYFGQNNYFADTWEIPDAGQKTARLWLQDGRIIASTGATDGASPLIRMVVNSDGNTGIGADTTPNAKLDVQGDLRVDSHITQAGDNNYIYQGAASDVSMSYDGTDWVFNPREVGTGAVNIESGNDAGFNEGLKLTGGAAAQNSGAKLTFINDYGGSYPTWNGANIQSGYKSSLGSWGTYIDFLTNNGSSLTDSTSVLYADKNGITLPTGALINGVGQMILDLPGTTTTFGDSANNHLFLGGTSSTGANKYNHIGFGYGSLSSIPAALIGFQTTEYNGQIKGDLVFGTRDVITATEATERMRIHSEGNIEMTENLSVAGNGYFDGDVGIGTTTPDSKLEVNGTGHFTEKVGIGTPPVANSLLYLKGTETLQLELDNTAVGGSVGMVYNTDDSIWTNTVGTTGHFTMRDVTTGTNVLILQSGSKSNSLSVNSANFIVNSGLQDLNFRVAGDVNNALLYTDAGNDRVGIGTLSTLADNMLTVAGNTTIQGDLTLTNGTADITFSKLDQNEYIDGSVFGISMTNPPNVEAPHFWLQSGGGTQASGVARSFMIVNEDIDILNSVNRTSCNAWADHFGKELRIDCNTTTTGADLLVGDDMQVFGTIYTEEFQPYNYTIIDGTYTSGVIENVTQMFGEELVITEKVGAPGYDIHFNISTNGQSEHPKFIVIRWAYNGGAKHIGQWDIWDYEGEQWFALRAFTDDNGISSTMTQIIPVMHDGNFVNSDNEMKIRAYQSGAGSGAHTISFDYIGVKY